MKTFLCSHLVTVRWEGQEMAANLEKISAEIASVNAEEALPVGTAVTIGAGACELAGVVASAETDPFGYFIDVKLEEAWSPEMFLPDHFFDPDLMPPGKLRESKA